MSDLPEHIKSQLQLTDPDDDVRRRHLEQVHVVAQGRRRQRQVRLLATAAVSCCVVIGGALLADIGPTRSDDTESVARSATEADSNPNANVPGNEHVASPSQADSQAQNERKPTLAPAGSSVQETPTSNEFTSLDQLVESIQTVESSPALPEVADVTPSACPTSAAQALQSRGNTRIAGAAVTWSVFVDPNGIRTLVVRSLPECNLLLERVLVPTAQNP